MASLSSRFDEAFRYAHAVHADQQRKATNTPYISHLMGVASIVLDDGGTEDEAIAALLHEAVGDRGGRARLEEIRARFGNEVARIVEDCTGSWETPARPRAERVEHARQLAPSSLRVSAADQVHDAYVILRDLRNDGDDVWGRFDAAPDDVLSYYEALVRSYREAGGGRLVDELSRIVRGIRREIGY